MMLDSMISNQLNCTSVSIGIAAPEPIVSICIFYDKALFFISIKLLLFFKSFIR